MDCNRAPDWSDDDDVDGPIAPCNPQQRFDNAVKGMLGNVADAADPTYPLSQPYRGNIIDVAIYSVTYVVREARKRGLYPGTVQLEAETRVSRAA